MTTEKNDAENHDQFAVRRYPDNQLKNQVRKFESTQSVGRVILDRFFPTS